MTAVSRFTQQASTTNESASSASPNSSARAGATRPDATGRACVRSPMSWSMSAVEDVVQGRRAAAGEREPAERGDGEAERRPPLRAENEPAGARDEEQRHDPRLRQRDVVAPRRARGLDAAAEHQRGSDHRRGERRAHPKRCAPGTPRRARSRARRSRRRRSERGRARARSRRRGASSVSSGWPKRTESQTVVTSASPTRTLTSCEPAHSPVTIAIPVANAAETAVRRSQEPGCGVIAGSPPAGGADRAADARS